jgi:Biotin-(acetyl-CoA carboxylase) ligase
MMYFETLPSTNAYCKENMKTLAHGEVVWTKNQTAGYGQHGRTWLCDDNLAVSVVLKGVPTPQLSGLREVCLDAIKQGISAFGRDVDITPPNDFTVNGKKVGGCLCESIITGSIADVVVGFGLNTTSAPENLPNGGGKSLAAQSLDLQGFEEEVAEICSTLIVKAIDLLILQEG